MINMWLLLSEIDYKRISTNKNSYETNHTSVIIKPDQNHG